ncbi:MAG: hypothetical protein ACE5IM_08050, partial [Nitrospinota bacterium]
MSPETLPARTPRTSGPASSVDPPGAGKSRRIYLLRDLPPEVVAVAFAKTSRSPKSFDEIAAELTDEASA